MVTGVTLGALLVTEFVCVSDVFLIKLIVLLVAEHIT